MFDDAELSEIENHPFKYIDGSEATTIALAEAWRLHVAKIDEDRALPWTDHRVWNEHDLAGALFLRDRLERTLNELPVALVERMRSYVAEADDQFRSYTVTDTGIRIAKIAGETTTEKGWWWFRVPRSGPIAQDLARYSASGDYLRPGGAAGE
jgi:hypothetical protein